MSLTGTGLHTERQLTRQLAELGVEPGGFLLVHASLRAVGAVVGGGEAVLRAVRGALGPDGTVVVPAFTARNSDTSPAHRERVRGLGEAERAAVRAAMPPYDADTMPCDDGIGVLPEIVRRQPGAVRSAHPQTSFAALGPHAEKVVSGHRQDCHLGEDSPLARLYDLRAQILLLGRVSRAVPRSISASTGGRAAAPYVPLCGAGRWGAAVVGVRGRRAGRRRLRRAGRGPGAVRRWFGTDGCGGVGALRLVGMADAVDFARLWLARNR